MPTVNCPRCYLTRYVALGDEVIDDTFARHILRLLAGSYLVGSGGFSPGCLEPFNIFLL